MDKNGIFLTNRHISLVVAALMILSFFVFLSGYFFGKKKTVDKFYNKVDQESLADHVFYSVCANYGAEEVDENQESTEDAICDNDFSQTKEENVNINANISNISDHKVENSEDSTVNIANNNLTGVENKKLEFKKAGETNINTDSSVNAKEVAIEAAKDQYYAELVGFGSKQRANEFCNRLQKNGISVVVKKRKSRTARGKNIFWYQAITEKFDNKSDLVAFVDIIKDKENLKGIKIIQC